MAMQICRNGCKKRIECTIYFHFIYFIPICNWSFHLFLQLLIWACPPQLMNKDPVLYNGGLHGWSHAPGREYLRPGAESKDQERTTSGQLIWYDTIHKNNAWTKQTGGSVKAAVSHLKQNTCLYLHITFHYVSECCVCGLVAALANLHIGRRGSNRITSSGSPACKDARRPYQRYLCIFSFSYCFYNY